MKRGFIFTACIAVLGSFTLGCTTSSASSIETAEPAQNESVYELDGRKNKQDIREFQHKLPGGMQEINVVELSEQGSNIRRYRIDALQNGEWKTVYNNDLVEAYHLCVLPETVQTDMIRVVVEEETAESKIMQISARLKTAGTSEKKFTNTAYVSSTYFEHSWDNIHQKNFESLSDIIMIGNFCFNTKGEFVIVQHGPDGTGVTPYAWDDPYILDLFEQWKDRVMIDPTNRLWVSVTNLENGRTDAFHNKETRTAFIKQLVSFAEKYNITGFDVDWEYPGTSSQWQDYNNLIFEASAELHANGIMLSSAQSTGSGLSVSALNALDRVNIMSYDNYGTMNNHSTFYNSAVRIINEFKNKGVEAKKLVLGMPYYGVKVDSYYEQWDYSHIYNQMMQEQGFVDPGVNIYAKWGFNGANLIRDKVLYAIEQEIGGVFIWQMKNDITDFDSDLSLAGTARRTLDRFLVP